MAPRLQATGVNFLPLLMASQPGICAVPLQLSVDGRQSNAVTLSIQ